MIIFADTYLVFSVYKMSEHGGKMSVGVSQNPE